LKKNEAYRKEFCKLAHEFKTRSSPSGYVDTLLAGDGRHHDPEKFLENTAKNVERLVNLMNDLDEISPSSG